MDLIEFITTVIYTNFVIFSILYTWHKLLNKKIDFKSKKLYIAQICLVIITILNYYVVNKLIRICVITLIFMIFFKYLFGEKLKKCIITPIFQQVIMSIIEFAIVFILMIIIGNKIEIFINSFLGILIINILISVALALVSNINIIKTLYNKTIKITDKIKNNQLIILCLISILFLNIYLISAYYKIDFRYWVMANIFLIIVLLSIIVYSLKTQEDLNKVSNKYNIAIKSLNDYETMMTKYRVANHENKNLLLTIRAMILNSEKDIPEYIDTMIEDKYEDDEKLLFNMAVIPSGGLRATIYSEILKIKENNINYSLDIDKKIRSVDLIELDTNTIVDICKIVGVFIDNAIDETKKLKNKNIKIGLYLENEKLNIKISNNYKGKIDVDRISDEGYTTKGEGHGYGLLLVKMIVNDNKLLQHSLEISKSIFSQIITIKYKKSH